MFRNKLKELALLTLSIGGMIFLIYLLAEDEKSSYIKEETAEYTVGFLIGEIQALKIICLDHEPRNYIAQFKNNFQYPMQKSRNILKYHPQQELKQIVRSFTERKVAAYERAFFVYLSRELSQQKKRTRADFCQLINQNTENLLKIKKREYQNNLYQEKR